MRSAYSSSRQRAETRLGLPRPSLDSMRQNRGNFSEVETDYEEDDYLSEDEAAAEAYLSRKHGEASEASESKPAKRSTDEDIADEYKQQEKERKKKARKVIRTLMPEDLIKPKGLTVVRNGIAPKFQSANYVNTPKSMAKFSRRLIGSYMDWMDNLSGGLTLQDAQWKLKTMGSKTQIKQYLQDMRNSVRNDHVERLLGLETAQRLLSQLEDYYNEEQQQYNEEEEEPNYDDENADPAITNPYNTRNASATSETTDENNNNNTTNSVAVTPTNNKPQTDEPSDQIDTDDPLIRRLQLQKEHRLKKQKHVLDDSDDDEEQALFDDVAPAASTPATTKNGARRHVLDDDSDDDDDEEEEEAANKEKDNQEETKEDVPNITDSSNGKEDAEDHDETSSVSQESLPEESSSAQKLDEKFQSVKALLEGGDSAVANEETEAVEEKADAELETEVVENAKEPSFEDEALLEDSENEF